MIVFHPLVKAFTFISSLLFPGRERPAGSVPGSITEDETKILLAHGVKGDFGFPARK